MAKTRNTPPAPVADVVVADALASMAGVLAAPASVALVDKRAAAAAAAAAKTPALAQAISAAVAGTVPRHILASFGTLATATVPTDMRGKLVVRGRDYNARQHNATWAAAMQACVDAAGPAGAPVEACVQAVLASSVPGSGWHSVRAYLERGWFKVA